MKSSLWLAMVCAAMASSAASARDVIRSDRKLSGEETRLERVTGAPETRLSPQGTGGGLVSSSPQTGLKSADTPSTLLREAEVPPERLERTRELLIELKAQPTPAKAISIDLPADVLFDFDKHELRVDAAPSLDKAAELIKSYPNAPLLVRGHTDGKGSDAYNDRLSERRAASVAKALETRTGRHPATQGLGRREPVAPNLTPDGKDNPEGRQLNRRVQILIEVAPPQGG
ncbi:OmpA family protein [Diaphorobacter sp. HDW4B]|uniref:OmpA family protein n=1 Tax=Diaphorobacter sp. HDW4B TaxID=2714925 RepID=UPI001F0D938D|nr:OmpA family protein [Diaphorobacter sp. HDW4B]